VLASPGMERPADLYAILACPVCRAGVARHEDCVRCEDCGRSYPVVSGVPVMLPNAGDGQVPSAAPNEPHLRRDYFPWVHRVVLQSLLDDQIVLELGSGNLELDDPCIVRMDAHLTPHVDVVGDIHQLPFRSSAFDFVFSLAVLEHLRQPFQAVEEIRRVTRDGGYVYHECNFVYPYHAIPHHYFNASVQGLDQLFAGFRRLRTGVAPYQMPSFALSMILFTYLQHSTVGLELENLPFVELLQRVFDCDLVFYDRYFTEPAALNLAAGVFVFALRQDTPSSTVIPAPIWQAWEADPALRSRIPDPLNLGTADNLLRWAVAEGASVPAVVEGLRALTPFNKRGPDRPFDRSSLRAMPVVEPRFGVLYDYPDNAPRPKPQPMPVPPPKPEPPGWRGRVPRVLRRWADRVEEGGMPWTTRRG
jgi:uncharacterized protein YbaR (Trm112 family)/SAM-dependent methyltransferase